MGREKSEMGIKRTNRKQQKQARASERASDGGGEKETHLEVPRVACKVRPQLGAVEQLALELGRSKLADRGLRHGAQRVLDAVAERLNVLEVEEQRRGLAAALVGSGVGRVRKGWVVD